MMKAILFVAIALVLAACGRQSAPTPTQTPVPVQAAIPAPTIPPVPVPPPTPDAATVAEIWRTIPHVAYRIEQAQDAAGVILATGRVRIDDWPITKERFSQFGELPDFDDLDGATLYGSVWVTVTNATAGKVSIYPAQGTVVVGNEQVNVNHWLSDNVGGELFPGVVATGEVRFWLKRITFAQIAQGVEVLYEVNAPTDADYNRLADAPYLFHYMLAPE